MQLRPDPRHPEVEDAAGAGRGASDPKRRPFRLRLLRAFLGAWNRSLIALCFVPPPVSRLDGAARLSQKLVTQQKVLDRALNEHVAGLGVEHDDERDK